MIYSPFQLICSVGILFFLVGCGGARPSRHEAVPSGLKRFVEFSQSSAADPTPNCGELCTKLRTEFRYVVYVGREIYCYWDQKKAETQLDYDALATTLERSITDSTSMSSYFRILRHWASSFHDGHVNVMTQEDMTGLEIYTAPIRIEVMAPATDHEKVIVVKVEGGTPGVSVGDQVLSVNGVPIHDALTDAVTVASSGSTERMRRLVAGRRLVDVLGVDRGSEPWVLSLSTSKGEVKTVSLMRSVEIHPKPVSDRRAESAEASGVEQLKASVLQGSIGYLRVDGFSGSQDEFLLDQVMDRLAGTKGLILDLRRNGGGDLSGDRILARLVKNEIVRYRRSERMSPFLLSSRPESFFVPFNPGALFADWHDLKVAPHDKKHYSQPVVALISPYCFSACDTFSAALKDYQLATLMGEPTGGGTGTPLVFDLPISGLKFRYSVVRGQTPRGNPIEGVGTLPDLYLEPTVEDRIHQKDSQLLAAVEFLSSKMVVGGAPSPALKALDFVKSTWDQDLSRSPTKAENDDLRRIAARDELKSTED